MNDSSRRQFLATSVLSAGVVGGATLRPAAATASAAPEAVLTPSFAGVHQPKPLPFDPSGLPGLSEKLLRSHWDNNYGGAVKALNAIERRLSKMLDEPDLPPFVYGPLKREEIIRTGSVVLHDLYFGNLGGDGAPGGDVLKAVANSFGSFARWQTEFQRTAMALAGGSGWVVLAKGANGDSLHNYWMADHAHAPIGAQPLLVLDMYEHAFQIDYGAAAAKYIDAFLRNINWTVVDARFKARA